MNRIFTLFRIALILAIIPCAASAQTVTLEKLLSAPFPSEISAAPTAPRVAWIQTKRGLCNLFVADAPDYRARQSTKYTKDDGQRLSNITWSSDAKAIVYVRGDGPNRAGENPNPTSDPAGAEQALWRISVDGGEPVKIGIGSAPTLSPRGDQLVFLKRGQIFATSFIATAKSECESPLVGISLQRQSDRCKNHRQRAKRAGGAERTHCPTRRPINTESGTGRRPD